jgi:hypothetical protein
MNSEPSELRTWLDGKFSAIDGRLDAMNARFDQMPTREEMNARFAQVATREEMDARFALVPTREEMRAGFAQVATREEMNARFALVPTREEMRAGFAQVATREEMQAQGSDLRAAIQGLHDESVAANVELREYIEFVFQRHAGETRRHFDVVADGLRDDIKKVAEAQVATTERIDRLERKMDSGFADIRRDVAGIIDIAFKRRDRRIRGR